ncbi:MAG: gamma-glutamylcyclotransferase family protein [Bacteroidota bacterium]
MINDLLFVYGTLLSADNEFGRYLKNNATFFCDGKFKGRLYDIGEYPGAITSTDKEYDIKGSIHCLSSADVLKVIDDYEGYGDGQDEPYLYLRKKLPVTTPEGVVDCWVYLYNLSVDGLVEILGGDYFAYKMA